jgi:hypothetical protein
VSALDSSAREAKLSEGDLIRAKALFADVEKEKPNPGSSPG